MHKLKIIHVRLMRIVYIIPSAMINKVIAKIPVNTVRWKRKLRIIIFLVYCVYKFTVSKEKSFTLHFLKVSVIILVKRLLQNIGAVCLKYTQSHSVSPQF